MTEEEIMEELVRMAMDRALDFDFACGGDRLSSAQKDQGRSMGKGTGQKSQERNMDDAIAMVVYRS